MDDESILSDVTSQPTCSTGSTAMNMNSFELKTIGRVESTLTALEAAPRQADEGAPPAWLVFDEAVREGLANLRPGDRLIVLTWLDRARRDVLAVHPRGDTSRPREGVFSTRSPHRPNPIGLHRVRGRRGGRSARRGRPSRGAERHADRGRQAGARRERQRAVIAGSAWVLQPVRQLAYRPSMNVRIA